MPGGSTDIWKGYVLEMTSNNALGYNPNDAVVVVTDVKLNGVSTGYTVVPVDKGTTCTCSACGGLALDKQFCAPDGWTNQKILIFTDSQNNSQASTFTVSYQRYECDGNKCVPFDKAPLTEVASLTTPSANGSKCEVNWQPYNPNPAQVAGTASAQDALDESALNTEKTATPESTKEPQQAPEPTKTPEPQPEPTPEAKPEPTATAAAQAEESN